MKINVLITTFIVLAANYATAQDLPVGRINIKQDTGIALLLEKKKTDFLADSMVSGYRIQIFSTTDRRLWMQESDKLKTLYPDLPVYMKYDAPNFKIRVGNFFNKLEAEPYFRLLIQQYPRLFIVPDKILPSGTYLLPSAQ